MTHNFCDYFELTTEGVDEMPDGRLKSVIENRDNLLREIRILRNKIELQEENYHDAKIVIFGLMTLVLGELVYILWAA
jgi:hypothetical protein